MNFTSTRNKIRVKSMDAIISGLSLEGGLFISEEIISLDYKKLLNKKYSEIAYEVLSLYFTDFDQNYLKDLTNKVYSNSYFNNDNITNIIKYKDNSCLLELFYGKTSAFKDMALSIYSHLLSNSMKNKDLTNTFILTATSGDTGSAAMESVRGVNGLNISVIFPEFGTSKTQRLQMTTMEGDNIHPISILGNFDDAQSIVKEYFKKNNKITSANSINIARLYPQVVYYYDLYVRLVRDNYIKEDQLIDISVPTGNFGNILAAYVAKMMGLPIDKLIVSTNDNNVLHDFIQTGEYDLRNRSLVKTYSPSMDILISSNLERLLYLIIKDENRVSSLMEDLKNKKYYKLTKEEHKELRKHFDSKTTSNEGTKDIITKFYKKYNILIDPHTATSIIDNNDTFTVSVSTASPYKFIEVYKDIFNLNLEDDFIALKQLEEITKAYYPENIKSLEVKEVKHKIVLEKDQVIEYLDNLIKKVEHEI